jgi:hypothetical protein
MYSNIFKKYSIEILIAVFNFMLICFAVDFDLNLNSHLSFNIHDDFVEINYLLYFLISTLMLLAFNAVLFLLKSLAAINITMKIICTIIILFPLCALLFSMLTVYAGHYTRLSSETVYLPGLFFLITALMIYRLVQIFVPKNRI